MHASLGADTNPQTLLFSATCPPWVYDVAKKYMRPTCKHVDLIGKKTQKAATTVEVSVCAWVEEMVVVFVVVYLVMGVLRERERDTHTSFSVCKYELGCC